MAFFCGMCYYAGRKLKNDLLRDLAFASHEGYLGNLKNVAPLTKVAYLKQRAPPTSHER